jgi:type IX secretion system PorP/SprF family membrane protein
VKVLQAQDPTFTAFQMQRLELSPAYGGSGGEGKVQINSASRTSFYPVRGPFNYSSISLDVSPCTKLGLVGFGLLVNKESQGDGYYKKTRASLNFAYSLRLTEKNSLSFGLRSGIINQSIDWNEFTFSDQLHPINGIVNTSFNHGAGLEFSNTFDWDVGVKYNCYKRGPFKFMIGASVFNLIESRIGLIANSNFRMQRRFSIINSLIFNGTITSKINSRFESQGDFRYYGGNWELMFTNGIRVAPGLKLPMLNENGIRNNLYPTIMFGYQPNETIMVYFSYENNILGEIIRGKTSSLEVGVYINSFSSLCDGGKFKLIETKKFDKQSKLLGCPDLHPTKGKIQSF